MILLCVVVVRVAGPLSLLQCFPEVLPRGTPGWRGQPGPFIHQPEARGREIEEKVELAPSGGRG